MIKFTRNIMTASMEKTWFFAAGQAGYIIKSRRGELLAIDLYLSDCLERVEGHIGFKRMLPKILGPDELDLDILIATHPHRDHLDIDSIPWLMASGRTQLFASVECEKDIAGMGLGNENITYVHPGDHAEVGDFIIDFINCDHGSGAPDAFGVIVTVDGHRILEVGDSSLRLDRVDEYLSQGPIDIMIAPINGAYGNLNEEECARLSAAIKPGLTIPCHYGMFASHGGSPGKFMEIMNTSYPDNKYTIMTMGEGLEIG